MSAWELRPTDAFSIVFGPSFAVVQPRDETKKSWKIMVLVKAGSFQKFVAEDFIGNEAAAKLRALLRFQAIESDLDV